MALIVDAQRGKQVAELLYQSFRTIGIHGALDMPEDVLPAGMAQGSQEHLAFVTLSASIDYQRDAAVLWAASRRTYADPATRYLFDFGRLAQTSSSQVEADMRRYKLAMKPVQDARIWRTVGTSFAKKWAGNPREFLAACGWDAPTVLQRLKHDTHPYGNGQTPDFPWLRGDKIGPMWLRMLRDNVGIKELRRLEQVPIPVDVHVARATLALGVVRGRYSGNLDMIFETIRQAWFESVLGLEVDGRPMIALDLDEPLWHLSRQGCSTHRHQETGVCSALHKCEAGAFCVLGKLRVAGGSVDLGT